MSAEYQGTYLVIGPPGTGKTTFLGAQVEKIVGYYCSNSISQQLNPTPVLVCSLTKTAAAEVVGRRLPIPKQCVGTLHSHCYRALERPKVAAGEEIAAWNKDNPHYLMAVDDVDPDEPSWDQRAEMVSFGRAGRGDEMAGKYHLLRAKMTPRELWPSDVRGFAEAWEKFKSERGCIDFTDMIDLCLRQVDSAPGSPKVILADEAQDMSAMEYALLQKWGRAAGCLMAVGDADQALYVWRGAHPDLFNDPSVPDSHRKVLHRSYRVPRAVLDAGLAWVRGLSNRRDFEYAPRLEAGGEEALGAVGTVDATYKTPEAAINAALRFMDDGLSVMFIASCSFMLSNLVAALRSRGIPFANPWRRRRGDWNPLGAGRGVSSAMRLLYFLRPSRAVYGSDARWWTWGEFSEWASVIRAKDVFVRGAKTAIESRAETTPDEIVHDASLHELFEPVVIARLLQVVCDCDDAAEAGRRDAAGPLAGWFREHLAGSHASKLDFPMAIRRERGEKALTEQPRCFVGTCHSFKGAEADVVIIWPDISPAGYGGYARGGAMADPVIRTFYVAITRAKQRVLFGRPASDLAVPLERLVGRVTPRPGSVAPAPF